MYTTNGSMGGELRPCKCICVDPAPETTLPVRTSLQGRAADLSGCRAETALVEVSTDQERQVGQHPGSCSDRASARITPIANRRQEALAGVNSAVTRCREL